ncbi:GMC oxidoreductase [Phanerochaete sordida]|uniref:GMC oxidoreductase n=1 Tax=Phanerochaete sordida TaxID=48140 RepID=A0A9P3LGB2_9APHY|nr:GMC oxidoreductase [Phanerochaete sordida]
MSSAPAEFDVIFAGGGTSSCLIASRLADADPTLRILILESGGHTKDDLAHIQPARFLSHLAPTSTTVSFMVANPEPALLGRQTVVPCGNCVGGGSSVNFMMYTRAAASDYDDWETKFGNPGWGSKDLIPLLKKTETYEVAPGRDDVHGYAGPLRVSYGGIFTNIGKEFLAVGAAYDPQRGSTDDPNNLFEVDKYGRWQKWISAKTGKRSDVPHHFVYNKNHPNVTLTVGHLVKRVLFEDKRAVGVEYVRNKKVFPDASDEILIAKAKRLVVLSAGTFGSPVILERSGIGAKDILAKAGIEQLVDLPGVGENYQDHQVIFAPYLASDDAETIDGIVRSNEADIKQWGAQWLQDGSGLMASNALDAGVKIRPTPAELTAIGPAFAQKWAQYYAGAPDKAAMWFGPVSMLVGDPSATPARKYLSLGYYVMHPSSLGFVHARGADVNVPPAFETGFLRTPDDFALLAWGYKRSRELARRMRSYRGELADAHPVFKEGSAARCGPTDGPVPLDAPDIVYTPEDEEAIAEYTRKAVQTAWHSLGTCAMKPREQGGVVDAQLNVYGVTHLKVADLSIPPSNVAANTYSTTLAVAEKAALIIAAELGIVGV